MLVLVDVGVGWGGFLAWISEEISFVAGGSDAIGSWKKKTLN